MHHYGLKAPKAAEGHCAWIGSMAMIHGSKQLRRKCLRVAYEPNDKYTPEQISSLEQLDYQHITCHLVFAVKMDFIYNTHFVPNGLKIDAPLCQSHIQALLQEIVCDWH
eukprot:CCRYP_004994-RA/>CCRYP_004994-RA protein AED:0.59 eAED:0.48 QI:0/0/0/1/0/0/2/0/108